MVQKSLKPLNKNLKIKKINLLKKLNLLFRLNLRKKKKQLMNLKRKRMMMMKNGLQNIHQLPNQKV
tara:strand:- start:252 stop:449 length:198 start_codon:yes stop_codon:yes gene_type:complete